jgi:serine/threonine-protein kinase
LTPAEDEPIFVLGLADTLIARLGNIPRLGVRPADAVRKYLDSTDPVAAGRELKVDAVLEGTIRRDPGRVRVDARLMNVSDGHTLWSGSFERPPGQQFALEDAVASEVAGAMAIRLTTAEKKLLSKHGTENPEAYQSYMRGRFFWNKRNREAFQKAIGYFEQAIRQDPSYAMAYAGLADAEMLLGGYSYVPQKEVIAAARAAVEKALQLDGTLAEAHTTLALIHENYDWDWPATEREYKLAIRFNPNHATAHGWYGEFLSYMVRPEESMAEMQKALELDPLNLSLNTDSCKVFYTTRQFDKAIAQCRRVLELDPDFAPGHARLSAAYTAKKMYPEALAEAQYMRRLEDTPEALGTIGSVYGFMGDRKSALRYLALIDKRAETEYIPPFNRSGIFFALGDYDQWLALLEKTYESRGVGLIILKAEPMMDPVRGMPRVQALLRKMNF